MEGAGGDVITERRAYWLFILFAFLTFCKLFLGINYHDEIQYLGAAVMSSLGGKPFVNEPFIQQIADLYISPIMELYVYLVGSFYGLIMFGRFLYWLIYLGIAIAFYKTLADLFPENKIAARLSSCLFFAYTLSLSTTVNYCSMGTGFLTLSFLCFLISGKRPGRRWSWLSGFCLAISMSVYATMILAAVLFVLVLAAGAYFNPKLRNGLARRMTGVFAGATVTSGIIFVWLLSYGWENLLDSFKFSASIDHIGFDFARTWVIKMAYLPIHFSFFANGWLPAFCMVVASIMVRKKIPFELTLIAIYSYLTYANWRPVYPVFSILLISLVSLFSFYSVLQFRKKSTAHYEIYLIVVTMILMAPVIAWISGATFHSSPIVTLISTVFTLFAIAASGRPSSQWSVVMTLFIFAVITYTGCILDAPFMGETVVVKSGPAAGIVTWNERRDFVGAVEAGLAEAEKYGKTIFSPTYPMAYLQSRLKIHSRSVYAHSFELPGMLEQYDAYFQKFGAPDIYFEVKMIPYIPGEPDDYTQDIRYQGHMALRQILSKYAKYRQLMDINYYTIWVKI